MPRSGRIGCFAKLSLFVAMMKALPLTMLHEVIVHQSCLFGRMTETCLAKSNETARKIEVLANRDTLIKWRGNT
jgi:hypothetical protein